MSFVFLVAFELLMVLFLPRITKKLGLAWRVANVTYVHSLRHPIDSFHRNLPL